MKKLVAILTIVFMCSSLSASIDYKNYQADYEYKPNKPVRTIIKEILNRKKIERPFDTPNMIPIPWYDSIKPNRLKDLA
tara:strand:- start:4256 stop:4492 length:237 start_codon:yes stop_codon:yes gene_type:complete